ncbi:MAG: hypothetical protein ACLKAN_13450 [Alkaliphilus sp.]
MHSSKIFKGKSKAASKPGNRIRVIGYSDNPELADLDDVLTTPGSEINLINGQAKDSFKFFILGPIKKDSDDIDIERNETSIILQAKFDVGSEENAGIVILSGDASCYNWKRVLRQNELKDLAFDIFLAPHHCSWYFFSEESYDENPEPDSEIVKLIKNGRGDCYIIAFCKKITDDDDTPPHYQAAQLYKEIVGEDNFICTSEYPDEESPKPLIFSFTEKGPVKEEPGNNSKKTFSSSIQRTISKPKTYGVV